MRCFFCFFFFFNVIFCFDHSQAKQVVNDVSDSDDSSDAVDVVSMSKAEETYLERAKNEEIALQEHQMKKRAKAERKKAMLQEIERKQQEKKAQQIEETELRRQSSETYIPEGLLNVLGSLGDIGDDEGDEQELLFMEMKRIANNEQKKKKKKRANKKLKEMWDKAGVEVRSTKTVDSVKVQLPDDMKKFLKEVEDTVPRAQVVQKRKRRNSSTKK